MSLISANRAAERDRRGGRGKGGKGSHSHGKKSANQSQQRGKLWRGRRRGRSENSMNRGGRQVESSSSDSEIDAAVLADYMEHTLSDGEDKAKGQVPSHVATTMARISAALPPGAYSPSSPDSPPSPPRRSTSPPRGLSFKQRKRQGQPAKHRSSRPISFITAGMLTDVASEVTALRLSPAPVAASIVAPTSAAIAAQSFAATTAHTPTAVAPLPSAAPTPPTAAPLLVLPQAISRKVQHSYHLVGAVDENAEDEEPEVISISDDDEEEGEEGDDKEEEEEQDDDEDDEEMGPSDEAEDDGKDSEEVIDVDSDDEGDEEDEPDSSSSASEDLVLHGRLQVALNAAFTASLPPAPVGASPAPAAAGTTPNREAARLNPHIEKKQWRRDSKGKGKGKGRGRRRDDDSADEAEGDAELLAIVRALHREVQGYVMLTEEEAPLALTPSSRAAHHACLTLARLYGLKARAHGRQRSKYLMLTKSKHTALADARELSAFFDSLAPPKEERKKDGRSKHEKRSKQIRRAKRAAAQSARRGGGNGSVVGAGAAAVGEENVGHRLLVGMGWNGGGLGRDGEGITEPVQALMRHSRAGLGM